MRRCILLSLFNSSRCPSNFSSSLLESKSTSCRESTDSSTACNWPRNSSSSSSPFVNALTFSLLRFYYAQTDFEALPISHVILQFHVQ